MMNRKLLEKKYKKFNLSRQEIDEYVETIKAFETIVEKDIKDITTGDIETYMKYLIREKKNTYNNVIHFARYFSFIDKKEEYIFMTRYFNSIGIVENIVKRLQNIEEDTTDLIKNINLPPFGTSPEKLPEYTKDIMDKLNKYLPKKSCHKALAGNNHQIPKETFTKDKDLYQKIGSLEEYLRVRHQQKVDELTLYYKKNLVWFEQVITKEVLDFVKENQEILSGVLKDDKLYITKIPYDVNNYLKASNEKDKRYYACHCSFVRENILSEQEDIDKDWCYCSGGFAKYPFEVLLNQELNVELLETPLAGDLKCRFVIDLKEVEYKK